MDADMRAEANAVFDKLDANGDGRLGRNELYGYFESEFKGPTRPGQVRRLFNKVDTDSDNKISKAEFIEGWVDFQNELKEEDNIRAAFATFDADGSGTISADELCSVLTRPTEGKKALSREDALDIIGEFDKNGDGVLQMEEFVLSFAEVTRRTTA